MKNKVLVLLAGFSLLIPALFWRLWGADGPTTLYPFPALVFIPALFGFKQLAVAIPPILFFFWSPGLFQGDTAIRKRSDVLLIVAAALNVLWFAMGWKDGIAIQGSRYNYSVCAVNVVWTTSLWILWTINRRTGPSFTRNLAFHWLLFGWLAWQAFPFFGELP